MRNNLIKLSIHGTMTQLLTSQLILFLQRTVNKSFIRLHRLTIFTTSLKNIWLFFQIRNQELSTDNLLNELMIGKKTLQLFLKSLKFYFKSNRNGDILNLFSPHQTILEDNSLKKKRSLKKWMQLLLKRWTLFTQLKTPRSA